MGAALDPGELETLADPEGAGSVLSDMDSRYAIGNEIGRGGMGKVLECRDALVHRDIAIKINKKHSGDNRFLREARLQGQLEHPSIVPIYDLGTTKGGEFFFTMKRVRGQTFKKLMRQSAREYPFRRALSDFGRVCEAVAYAHKRCIIHRDIKASNVMVGEFGAVYLIDWGVAKQLSDGTKDDADSAELPGDQSLTQTGRMIGTPAFMPPEQRVGKSDHRSDIYSLGLMLGALLEREEVPPPELLAIVEQATQEEPDLRQQEVSEIYAAIERYLDGDRDALRRTELADRSLASVETILDQEAMTRDDYEEAMRNVGRALALAPGHKAAVGAFVRIMERQPDQPPPEVLEKLTESREIARAVMGRRLVFAYCAIFLLLPMFHLAGLRAWPALAVVVGTWSFTIFIVAIARRKDRVREERMVPEMICVNLACATISLITGWLVFLPMLVVLCGGGFAMWIRRSRRWLILAFGAASTVIPAVLLRADLIPEFLLANPEWSIAKMGLELSTTTTVALLGAALAALAVAIQVFGAIGDILERSELELHMRAWQLRKLAPLS